MARSIAIESVRHRMKCQTKRLSAKLCSSVKDAPGYAASLKDRTEFPGRKIVRAEKFAGSFELGNVLEHEYR